MAILTRLCGERPAGPLFLNNRGNKWTGDAVKCAFARVELETGKRYCHYMLRHSFITHKLVAGVDSHVVGKLAGHTNTAMIDSVCSHVADDYAYMLRTGEENPKGIGVAVENWREKAQRTFCSPLPSW